MYLPFGLFGGIIRRRFRSRRSSTDIVERLSLLMAVSSRHWDAQVSETRIVIRMVNQPDEAGWRLNGLEVFGYYGRFCQVGETTVLKGAFRCDTVTEITRTAIAACTVLVWPVFTLISFASLGSSANNGGIGNTMASLAILAGFLLLTFCYHKPTEQRIARISELIFGCAGDVARTFYLLLHG